MRTCKHLRARWKPRYAQHGRVLATALALGASMIATATVSPSEIVAPGAGQGSVSLAPQAAPETSGSIAGHVYRADSAVPLAGAIVELWVSPIQAAGLNRGLTQAARTGPDGAYGFSVSAGHYRIQVRRSGFVLGSTPVISIAAGQTVADADVRLQLAGVISGSVRDQYGEPVPRVPVAPICSPPYPPRNGILTDTQGNFRISGLPPSECYVALDQLRGTSVNTPVWYPNAASRDQARAVQVKAGQETESIDFRVTLTAAGSIGPGASDHEQPPPRATAEAAAKAGVISGVVRDQSNQPIEGAIVRVLCGQGGTNPGPIPHFYSESDDRGMFNIAGVPPGVCSVWAAPSLEQDLAGYRATYDPNAEPPEKAQTVQVAADAPAPSIIVHLPYFPVYTIRVRIKGESDVPPDQGYTVRVSGSTRPPTFARQDGTADLVGITPGSYDVVVTRVHFMPGPDGRIHGATGIGPPVGEAMVRVTDSDVVIEIPISQFSSRGA